MAITTEFVKSRELREMTVKLTYADANAVKIFALPAGARVVDWVVNIKTAFNGTTPTLDVGSLADPDTILAGISLATAGCVALTTLVTAPCYETTGVTDIYAVVSTGSTAGEVALTCVFSLDKLTRI